MEAALLSMNEKFQEQSDRLKSKIFAQEKKYKALEHRRQLDLEGKAVSCPAHQHLFPSSFSPALRSPPPFTGFGNDIESLRKRIIKMDKKISNAKQFDEEDSGDEMQTVINDIERLNDKLYLSHTTD